MVEFEILDKTDFSAVSSDIFSVLADNMSVIAPTGNSREEDYLIWYNSVSDGLKRDERKIILISESEMFIGFFQYYVNEDTFMMEEIQLKSEYHGKNIFRKLYGYLIANLSDGIRYVEAYANIENKKSIAILEHLGLKNIGMNKNGRSIHFKADYQNLINWYCSSSL